ncbi:MAG: hypothetical protein QNJ13_09055 [Paracoccaceae bacterium]|nr:hypothetical protein [Paracoccaceae bacterium]
MADLLARLRVRGARRIIAVVSLTLLGGILLWLAASQGMGAGWRAVLVLFGGAGLWGAWAVQKATETDILLTRDGLFDERGRELAPMDNIVAIDRGVFAFKPSSGFLVKLDRPMKAGWAPGVWWRFGRRLGVGGSVSGFEAKAMAEILELALADRAGTLKRD